MSRAKFRFQEGFSRIYRVGPKLQYATIQAAINQALADLVTPNAQNYTLAAQVEVYDKGSAYTENLTIYPGIHLKGISPRQGVGIPVTGNHTLAFAAGQAAQTREQNTLYVNDLAFTATTGRVFTLGGTAAVDVRLTDCSVTKTGSVDGLEAFLCSNSQATSRARLTDCIVTYSDTQGVAGTSYGLRIQNTFQFEMYGGRSGLFGSGAGNATMVRLEGTTAGFVFNSNGAFRAGGGTTPFPTHIAAFGPYAFELASASNQIILQGATVANTFANGSLANFVAAGIVRVLNSHIGLQSVSSKLCNGAAGNFFHAGMTVESTGAEGRNAIDAGISVTQINEGAKFEIAGSERSFRVGLGGFATVQAAVNAAAASGATEKVVQLTPGFYSEDVTVPLGIKIVGESRTKGGISLPCGIRSITIDPSTGAGDVVIENINLQRIGSSSYVLRTIGANALQAYLVNCSLSCQDAGTTDSLIELQNTNASSYVMFKDCGYLFETDSASHGLIDAQHSFFILNTQRSFSSVEIASAFMNNTSGAVASMLKLAASVEAEIRDLSIFGNTGDQKLAELNTGSVLRLFGVKASCSNLATLGNEMVTFLGAASFLPVHSELNFNDDADEGLLARDSGTRATATVTVDAGNTFDPGDAVVVNGISLVNGVDWLVGGSAALTADNIRAAINASLNPAILGKVYARNTGAAITVYSRKNGLSQNAPTNTLSVVDGGGASFTGVTTFAGGTNGAGGTIDYGQVSLPGEEFADTFLTITQNGEEINPTGGGGGGGGAQALWKGRHTGAAGDYWSTASAAYVYPAQTGAPALTQDFNDSMGVVSTASASRPGIAFTAPFTGTIKVTANPLFQGGTTDSQYRLVETSGPTVMGTCGTYFNSHVGNAPCEGFFSVVAGNAYEFALQMRTAAGTATFGGVSNDGVVNWSVEYVK